MKDEIRKLIKKNVAELNKDGLIRARNNIATSDGKVEHKAFMIEMIDERLNKSVSDALIPDGCTNFD